VQLNSECSSLAIACGRLVCQPRGQVAEGLAAGHLVMIARQFAYLVGSPDAVPALPSHCFVG
jgi:hypothetical protein